MRTRSERRGMLFELATSETAPRGATHAERMAFLRSLSEEARRPLLARIEALRSRDPDIQVLLVSSLFPVLIVRSTEDVLAELAHTPGVARVSPERDAELLAY